ncbi:hypothetical protein SRB17_79510 [Streptomyces sp. RB17]|nr:hypothetical protein [Streptomyces sp. RB17]
MAAVEGVGEGGLGVLPAQSVAFEAESAQVGRCDGHGMHRGAVVVEQAGHGDLAAACPAADGGGGFQDGHGKARLGERDGARETVRPRSHDDGVGGHRRAPLVCWNQRRYPGAGEPRPVASS